MWLVFLERTRLQLETSHVHHVLETCLIVVARVRVLATQDMRAATTVSLVQRVRLDPTKALQVTWVAPHVLMAATKPSLDQHLAWMSQRVPVAKLVAIMLPVVLRYPSLVELDFTVWMAQVIALLCPQVTTPLHRGQRMLPAEHSTTYHAPSAHTRMVTLAQPVAQATPQQALPLQRQAPAMFVPLVTMVIAQAWVQVAMPVAHRAH